MNRPSYPRAQVKRGRPIHVQAARMNISLAGIGRESGQSSAAVSAIANGRECSLEMADRIAAILGAERATLFDLLEAPTGAVAA